MLKVANLKRKTTQPMSNFVYPKVLSLYSAQYERLGWPGKAVAYPAWSSGSWSTPLRNAVTDNRELAAATNNKLTGLKNLLP